MTQTNSSAAETTGISVPTTPKKKGRKAKPLKVPKVCQGIQYNANKNPTCANFGVTVPEVADETAAKFYEFAYGGKGFPLLKCAACGEADPMKSNLCIVGKIERLGAYLKPEKHFCPHPRAPYPPRKRRISATIASRPKC